LSKFDYSIKKQIQNPKKIYCVDNGFVTSLGFRFSQNKGNLLENFVAIELKRMGKEIYYHKENFECDFVIKDKLKIIEAIQVCFDFNEKNEKRELNGLLEAMKKFDLKKGKPRKGEYAKMIADINKAKRILGWKPKRNLGDSVNSLIKWYGTKPRGWKY